MATTDAESTARGKVRRQAELEQVFSQERLDVLVKVASTRHWIILSVAFTVVVSAILWGIFGSIPVKVNGEGMLVRGGEVLEVTAPFPGTVGEIHVQRGDTVKPGEVVATLRQDEVRREMEQKCREHSFAKTETAMVVGELQRRLVNLRDRETKVASLVRRGLKPRSELLAIQGEIATASQQIQVQNTRVRTLDQECTLLKARVEVDSGIVSSAGGKVLELAIREGTNVSPGSPVLTLEPVDGPIKATVYVPAAGAKKVAARKAAHIAPSHIRPEKDGYLLGRVADISPFPATPESMKKVLGNDQTVERLRQQGPLYQVTLDLEPAPGTASGYRWTSGGGPDIPVETGTVCRASVIIERRCPLSFVVPSIDCIH